MRKRLGERQTITPHTELWSLFSKAQGELPSEFLKYNIILVSFRSLFPYISRTPQYVRADSATQKRILAVSNRDQTHLLVPKVLEQGQKVEALALLPDNRSFSLREYWGKRYLELELDLKFVLFLLGNNR